MITYMPRISLANKLINIRNINSVITASFGDLYFERLFAFDGSWERACSLLACPGEAPWLLRPPLEWSFHLVIFQGSLGGHRKHLTSWCTSAVLHIYKLCRKINLSFVTTYVDLGSEVLAALAPELFAVLPLTVGIAFCCLFWKLK